MGTPAQTQRPLLIAIEGDLDIEVDLRRIRIAASEVRLAGAEWSAEADMARVGNVSPSRLHAQFREYLHMTPMQFVTDRRIHRAMDLLEHTALPMSEIALRVGYGDQAAFTRAFQRQAGEAPRAYRARVTAQ